MVENAAVAPATSIVDRLAGKTILLTGVTGFLGQVIFERLLGDVPEGRIVLLVRSQTGSTSRARVEYLFRKPAFDVLRERMGDDGLSSAPGRAGHDRGRGLLTRRAAAPRRHRHRDPLRRDGGVRPADRRGVPDEPVRRHEPVPRRDRERRLRPCLRAHLDRLRRRRRQGRRSPRRRSTIASTGGPKASSRSRRAETSRDSRGARRCSTTSWTRLRRSTREPAP